MKPHLSIVIPAYNESSRLVPTLERIREYLSAQDYAAEVIVVSDGSTDATAAVARDWCPPGFPLAVIDRKQNRGKGYSVREGGAAAAGELVLFSDADLSTPIEEFEKFRSRLAGGAAVVIGSRNLSGADLEIRQPFYRRVMGRVFNLVVKTFAVGGIADTQCGFKCFAAEAFAAIASRCLIDGFSFDVEMLFLARRLGFKIEEVPVRWLNAEGSTVSPVRDSIRMFFDVVRVRWNHLCGRYR